MGDKNNTCVLSLLVDWAKNLPVENEEQILFKIDTLNAISKTNEFKNWDIYKKLVARLTPVGNRRYFPIRNRPSKSTPGKYNTGICSIVPNYILVEHKKERDEYFLKLNRGGE